MTPASEQDDDRRRRARWVARHILPHEPATRRWLRARLRTADDVDDLMQDAYARIAVIDRYEEVERPGAFFRAIVRNLLIDHVRRERIVRIEAIDDIDAGMLADDRPDPERIAGDRRDLERVMRIVADLPARCQAVFRLRKIEGLSQRDIAERLGVTEGVVENEGVKGLLLVARALRGVTGADRFLTRRHGR